ASTPPRHGGFVRMPCVQPFCTDCAPDEVAMPKLLMLDNYDSFTYNLVQYFGELGQDVIVVRNDQITVDEIAQLAPDRICVSPGPGAPEQAGISVELIRAFAGRTPILGVCLGHQAIGAAYGGVITR